MIQIVAKLNLVLSPLQRAELAPKFLPPCFARFLSPCQWKKHVWQIDNTENVIQKRFALQATIVCKNRSKMWLRTRQKEILLQRLPRRRPRKLRSWVKVKTHELIQRKLSTNPENICRRFFFSSCSREVTALLNKMVFSSVLRTLWSTSSASHPVGEKNNLFLSISSFSLGQTSQGKAGSMPGSCNQETIRAEVIVSFPCLVLPHLAYALSCFSHRGSKWGSSCLCAWPQIVKVDVPYFQGSIRCSNNNGGCSHFCRARGNTHTCECFPGFALINGTKCIGKYRNMPLVETTKWLIMTESNLQKWNDFSVLSIAWRSFLFLLQTGMNVLQVKRVAANFAQIPMVDIPVDVSMGMFSPSQLSAKVCLLPDIPLRGE